MARQKKTLDAAALTALGAVRLADLLMELGEADGAIKKRLKLELAAHKGGEELAAEIRKRLAAIAKSRTFVDWRKMRSFAQELGTHLDAITTHLVPKQPSEAFELLWRFLDMGPSIYERCDDSDGSIGAIMADALEELGRVSRMSPHEPSALAERLFAALRAADYGQLDGAIGILAPALGPKGLGVLRGLFETLAGSPPEPAPPGERRIIGYSSRGPLYEDDLAASRHADLCRSALTEIADAMGDVDGYISRFTVEEQTNPALASRIAERLLVAGRIDEALAALNKAAARRKAGGYWPDWDRLQIDALEASGCLDEAQQLRWSQFETHLNSGYLKGYLGRLADFDDDEAEEKAVAHAAAFADFHSGLRFLVDWKAVEAASTMILARSGELNGDDYGALTAAADCLESRHPLAATLALRAMIDFALEKARSKRYRHAARHLQTCSDLADRIGDFGGHPKHDAYLAQLRSKHGRRRVSGQADDASSAG